ERFAGHLLLRPYGLVGIRGDCDFLLWQVAEDLDSLVALQTALNRTDLGGYLTLPYSYLAMTRRSIYEFPEDPSQPSRLVIRPSEARYLFVYPFTKTRPWYMLPKAERQTMMDEHVRADVAVGHARHAGRGGRGGGAGAATGARRRLHARGDARGAGAGGGPPRVRGGRSRGALQRQRHRVRDREPLHPRPRLALR